MYTSIIVTTGGHTSLESQWPKHCRNGKTHQTRRCWDGLRKLFYYIEMNAWVFFTEKYQLHFPSTGQLYFVALLEGVLGMISPRSTGRGLRHVLTMWQQFSRLLLTQQDLQLQKANCFRNGLIFICNTCTNKPEPLYKSRDAVRCLQK